MKYCFYYDESEHSRVINLSTVTGETYYDGFLATILGGAAITKQLLNSVIMLLKKNTLIGRKKES